MVKKIGIATRFYGLAKEDVERLSEWVRAAREIVPEEQILIAIRKEEDKSGGFAYLSEHYPSVTAFEVTPWGRVVQAPNALLIKAAGLGITHLLFSSSEYPVTKSLITRLESHMDENTLVAGARLEEHDFVAQSGERVAVKDASGLQIPWNTYALWSLEHLIHTGFVLTADSFEDPDNAGMEEMGTIAAQQILWPGKAVAKLINPKEGDLIVNTHSWTIDRRDRHMSIIATKNSKSQEQLKRLSLPPPLVEHIG